MYGHYNESSEGETIVRNYNLIIDGVRIYGPADGKPIALETYRENGEEFTNYELIRDTANNQDTAAIIVDGMSVLTPAQMKTYSAGAPKNELYLMSNGTAAFDVDFSNLTDAKLGLKAANGKSCSVTITGKNGSTPITMTVNSATEQYISLRSLLNASGTTTITVSNGGSGILSLTRLMTTTNTAEVSEGGGAKNVLSVSSMTAPRALAVVEMLNADLTIDEESINTTSADDGTVTLTLKTSEDAETVVVRDAEGNVVDPESIEFTIDETGVKNWTIILAESESGEYTYTLQAEYENGYAPEEPTTVSVTVTIPEPEDTSIGGRLDKIKGLFARLIELIRKIIALFK